MKEESFKVNFVARTNCFLYLPESWMQQVGILNPNISEICLKMSYGENNYAYFTPSVQPYNGNGERTVGINATYAQKLGIKENEEVLVSMLTHVPSVGKVNVCLISSEDWEICEASIGAIHSRLLSQIRVVWPGQVFVTWVSKYLHFSLHVDALDPTYEVGILEVFTDLVVDFPTDTTESNTIAAIQEPSNNIVPDNTSAMVDTTRHSDCPRDESEQIVRSDLQINQPSSYSVWDIMKRTLSSVLPVESGVGVKQPTDVVLETDSSTLSALSSYTWKPKTIPFRLHPLRISESMVDTGNATDAIIQQPFSVFVHKCNLPAAFARLNSKRDILICQLSKVAVGIQAEDQGAKEKDQIKLNTGTEDDVRKPRRKSSPKVYARVYVIDDIYKDLSRELKTILKDTVAYSEHNCILVPHLVQRALRAKIGTRLYLSVAANNATNLAKIEIVPLVKLNTSKEELEVMFTEYLTRLLRHNSVVLNTAEVVQIPVTSASTMNVLINLLPSEMEFTVLNYESFKRCKIEVKEENISANGEEVEVATEDLKENFTFFGQCTSRLVVEGLTAIEMSLGLQPSSQRLFHGDSHLLSNILIVGSPGSGKTTLSRHLRNKAARSPYFVHCVEVQCRHLKGKTVETLQKRLQQWIEECVYHQPAILVLDDIDAIAGTSSHEEEHSPDETYNFRVGEMIAGILERVQRSNYVLVIATAQSVSKLSPALAAPRGQHFFKTLLEVPELSTSDRLETLKAMLSQRTGFTVNKLASLDLTSHAAKAEGYVVQDIADMLDKAVFEGWKRTCAERKPTMSLEDVDIVQAMINTVPLSLRGVTLCKDTTQCWADVGGLTDVKRVLVEALQWPSQYAELFAKCPLRYQSGLLLYGAPGTGKTLLAGAVAHECGLNFISVKGPELLSKYIGASEEAVRNIFHKAQSARPCVLFFDEFDSLAPRRGHDSTGVTDRVVNQLLTQLDGVESLVGVWVVAATSRPDLLDPALLRPGRLDRAVLCSLPDARDRVDILVAQSRKMRLGDDVQLDVIAERSEGFTGADLQAVLYTAQMMAVEAQVTATDAASKNDAVTDDASYADAGRSTVGVLVDVQMSHLVAALADTRPSLPPDEKLKYKRIYDRFVGQRSGKNKELEVVSQRVTLA